MLAEGGGPLRLPRRGRGSVPSFHNLLEISPCRKHFALLFLPPFGGIEGGCGFYVVNVEHTKTVQPCTFSLAPFCATGTCVTLQRLFTLGDVSSGEHPCGKFLFQLGFLVVQFVVDCASFLLGLHLCRHLSDFPDLVGQERIVDYLQEVFPCGRNAVRISFLFVVKHCESCAPIKVYAQSAGL